MYIPKNILAVAGIKDEAIMEVHGNSIVLKPKEE